MAVMMLNKRQYPLDKQEFQTHIEPLIASHYKRPGRPEKISHYQFFCAVLYVLRTGIAWRDLPTEFGSWHTIYTRFKRWSENGLFWGLVYSLQQRKKLVVDIAWIDSTTVAIHRHGAGALKKKDNKPLAEGEKE